MGGWFDAEDLFGTLQVHRRLAAADPGRSFLVMGPWDHGGWSGGPGDSLGEVEFGSATAEFYRERIEAPFFRHYLKDGPDPDLAPAQVFETGSNTWRRFDAWPPPGTRPTPLYLLQGGRLGFRAPEGRTGSDAFVSDPAHPVPYTASTRGQGRAHVHGGGPALRRPARRTCWCTRRRSWTIRSPSPARSRPA